MELKKKFAAVIAAFLCIVSAVLINVVEAKADVYWPQGPEITTEYAVVMEASTGTVLYAKNENERNYPASITKIMTALVAIENGNLEDSVEFSEGAVYNTEGSSIMRDVGEHLSLKDCLYSLMLASANDSAYAIAEHVGGDYDTFVNMMNERAAEIGCTNTHFTNPHGLQDENHYVSAYDMALIAREAWKNDTFRMFIGTKVYNLPATEKHPEELTMQNHHAMLYPYRTSQYLYDYCVGGKTGYTSDAGSTLVTYAQKDGMTLICVVMKCVSPAHYVDTTTLLNYYFDNFKLVNVAENEETESSAGKTGSFNTNGDYLQIDQDASIVLPATASFSDVTSALVEEKTDASVVGTLQFSYGEHDVGTADIILTGAQAKMYPFDNAASLYTDHTGDQDASSVAAEEEGENPDGGQMLYSSFVLIPAVAVFAAAVLILLAHRKKKKAKFTRIEDNYRRKWKNKRR